MYKLKGCLINVLLILSLLGFFVYSGLFYSMNQSQIINQYKVSNTSYTFILRYNLASQKISLYYRKPFQFKDTYLTESAFNFITKPTESDYDVVIDDNSVKVIINGNDDKIEVLNVKFDEIVTFTQSTA